MLDFVNWYFSTGLGIATIIIAGVFGLIGIISNFRSNRAKQIREIDNELISKLSDKVQVLEDEMVQVKLREEKLVKEVGELNAKNKMLIDILQGRDAQTQEFYKAVFEAIKTGNDTHSLVKGMSEAMKKMAASVDKFVEAQT